MSKLRVDPAQGSLGVRFGAETIATALAGGKSRFRRDQLGAAAVASVEWYLDAGEYDYLMAFYRARAGHGSLQFQVDLILDASPVAEYDAYFVPGTLELTAIRGSAYVVAAQLEVVPKPENVQRDTGLVLYRDAEAAPPGPLNLTLLNPALAFGGGEVVNNSFGWHTFYSDQFGADSVVASWRCGTGLSIVGLVLNIPAADGQDLGGNYILYAAGGGSIMWTPPGAGFNLLATGVLPGDQLAVIVKGGVVYYFCTKASVGSVEFLGSHPAVAAGYKLAGSILSGRITDVKLATF